LTSTSTRTSTLSRTRAQFKRPSFIILSIGSVVALSAVLMGMNGVHDLMFPGATSEDGGICSVGA
ncbi:unnamed protein product, partial [Hapterophycus canaliculatus]